MASVTSLPELTVGISSVTVAKSADLAAGDVLGSCAFNLLIISLLDAVNPKTRLFSKVAKSHVLAGTLSIILITMVGAAIYLPGESLLSDWIAVTSILFIVVYILSIRTIYKYEMRSQELQTERIIIAKKENFRKVVASYIGNSLLVIAAGFFLPTFAKEIALITGLEESFFGTLFLAVSTSFPEIAVSFSAHKKGLVDIALGNLLGSNIFNILILAIDDFFYSPGHLLQNVSDNNLISVFSVIIMTSIAILGITYHQTGKRFFMAWDAFLILLVYILNLILLVSAK